MANHGSSLGRGPLTDMVQGAYSSASGGFHWLSHFHLGSGKGGWGVDQWINIMGTKSGTRAGEVPFLAESTGRGCVRHVQTG